MKVDVYLGLGSNMGDREENLRQAVARISELEGTGIKRLSAIYETDPVGYTDQGRFLNMVVCAVTELKPFELLEKLMAVELALKRERTIRWGPRTMDIDILLYGTERMEDEKLTVPHPRMFERAFVLIPLKEIFEGDTINGVNIEQAIAACNDREGVRFYGKLVI